MSDERRANPPMPNMKDFLLLLASGLDKLARDLNEESARLTAEQKHQQ